MAAADRNRSEVVVGFDVSATELAAFRSFVDRRRADEPLQYIEGTVPFGPVVLHVDSRVLIPRPETEFLFEQLELFADPRLRRVQLVCCCCDIQSVIEDREQIFQLLQFHRDSWIVRSSYGTVVGRDRFTVVKIRSTYNTKLCRQEKSIFSVCCESDYSHATRLHYPALDDSPTPA